MKQSPFKYEAGNVLAAAMQSHFTDWVKNQHKPNMRRQYLENVRINKQLRNLN